MYTAIATGELTSPTSLQTANFIKKVNNLFDNLNSKNLYNSNPLKCALSNNNGLVESNLRDCSNWIKSWTVTKNRPYCFNGLIQTINGILLLWDDLKGDFDFLLTNRCCQDPLENLFSQIRQRREFEPNPSVMNFRQALQTIMGASLRKDVESNYEDDKDIYLVTTSSITRSSIQQVQEVPDIEEVLSSSGSFISERSSISVNTSSSSTQLDIGMETCAITYFAGNAIFSALKKFNCKICETLVKNDEQLDYAETLILNKDYGIKAGKNVLKRPKQSVVLIVKKSLNLFEKNFKKQCFKHKIKQKLLTKLFRNNNIQTWINEDIECVEHKKFMLTIIYRAKLYNNSRQIIKKINSDDKQFKKPAKLAILKNL